MHRSLIGAPDRYGDPGARSPGSPGWALTRQPVELARAIRDQVHTLRPCDASRHEASIAHASICPAPGDDGEDSCKQDAPLEPSAPIANVLQVEGYPLV